MLNGCPLPCHAVIMEVTAAEKGATMKLLYILTLLIGIYLLGVIQFVTIAMPRDAYVAYVFSDTPDLWSVRMDEPMTSNLANYDVKAELVAALQERTRFDDNIYKRYFLVGLSVVAFSIVGLIREKVIHRDRVGGADGPPPMTIPPAAPTDAPGSITKDT
jgi:hypothetical protein